MSDRIIKTVKFPIYLTKDQENMFVQWDEIILEAYNLSLHNWRANNHLSDRRYLEKHPNKLAKRQQWWQKNKNLDIKNKKTRVVSNPSAEFNKKYPGLFDKNMDILSQLMAEECSSSPKKSLDRQWNVNSDIKSIDQIQYLHVDEKSGAKKEVRPNSSDRNRAMNALAKKLECYRLPAHVLYNSAILPSNQAGQQYWDNRKSKNKGGSQSITYSKKRVRLPQYKLSAKHKTSLIKWKYGASMKYEIQHVRGSKNARIFFSNKYFPEGIKIRYYKEFSPHSKIKSLSFSLEHGKRYINISYEENKKHWPTKTDVVGIDIGINRTLQLSDGRIYQMPIDKLKYLEGVKKKKQRKLKRKKDRNSKNYKKEMKKINTIDRKMKNIRSYHTKKFATEIARSCGTIYMEDLKLKNMTKSAKGTVESPGKNVKAKSGLNKALLRIAPYDMRIKIENKAKEYGRDFFIVDPKYTSQTCSSCGHVSSDSREGERFECVNCGHTIHADLNASINIRNRGKAGDVRVKEIKPKRSRVRKRTRGSSEENKSGALDSELPK